jgi:hypothetical protein
MYQKTFGHYPEYFMKPAGILTGTYPAIVEYVPVIDLKYTKVLLPGTFHLLIVKVPGNF